MNQVYQLVANVEAQKNLCFEELSLIANCQPSDQALNTLLRDRETTLYNRLTTLDGQRATYIDNFINESPVLSGIPQAHDVDVRSCHPKYIDSLKQFSSQDRDTLWAHLDNCSSSMEKLSTIWSFCNL